MADEWGKTVDKEHYVGSEYGPAARGRLPEAQAKELDQKIIDLIGQPGFDLMVDLFHDDIGKVLSISTINGDDKLIGMKPGPWEADFGLPKRAWPPALSRELSGKLSRP
mgnify:CR=1 FL=1